MVRFREGRKTAEGESLDESLLNKCHLIIFKQIDINFCLHINQTNETLGSQETCTIYSFCNWLNVRKKCCMTKIDAHSSYKNWSTVHEVILPKFYCIKFQTVSVRYLVWRMKMKVLQKKDFFSWKKVSSEVHSKKSFRPIYSICASESRVLRGFCLRDYS